MTDKQTSYGSTVVKGYLSGLPWLLVFLCVSVASLHGQDVNWNIDRYAVLGSDSTQFSTQAGSDGKPISGSNFIPTDLSADNYNADLYERPVTSSLDEYYNYVDIRTTYVGLDDDWFYYAIEVVGTDGGDLVGQYGFEVDFDGDNRGDFHFQVLDAKTPEIQSISWTNKNLEAWEDANNNIGGVNPLVGNDPLGNQDGLELEREKEGSNVYARIGRTAGGAAIPNVIEIAVRQSFVGNPATAGSLRGWATKGGQSLQNQLWNDEYTLSELGELSLGYISNFYEGDNSGGAGGGLTLILIGVDVEAQGPDQADSPGSTVDYTYRVRNSADGGTDVFNITTTSSNGWQIELLDPTGTTVYATDTDGDGTWDVINVPAQDSDSNGEPDTGDSPELNGGPDYEFRDYIVRVTIPPGATPGTTDTLTVFGETVKVDGNNNSVTDSDSNVTTVEIAALPSFTVLKLVQVDDGNSSPTDDYYVPGTVLTYNVVVTNTGFGSPDEDSFVFSDDLPDGVSLFVGDFVGGGGGPVDFTNGTPSSDLVYTFTSLASTTDSITFRDDMGGAIIPDDVANGGFDNSVRSFEIIGDGTFAPWSGSGNQPSITIEYRVRIDE